MKRVQRKRTKGWKMPENAIYVGRPTMFGNPFNIVESKQGGNFWVEAPGTYLNNILNKWDVPFNTKNEAAQIACNCYKDMIEKDSEMLAEIQKLKGKNLACWCSLSAPCHVDILIELLT